MKAKILEFPNGNIAIIAQPKKSSNTTANISLSTTIMINKEKPLREQIITVPETVFAENFEIRKEGRTFTFKKRVMQDNNMKH